MKKKMFFWLHAIKPNLTGSFTYTIILCAAALTSFSFSDPRQPVNGPIMTYVFTMVIIMAAAGAHYWMIKTRNWKNWVLLVCPTLFFSIWLICAAWTWMPFAWGALLTLTVFLDIDKEKEKIRKEYAKLEQEFSELIQDC